MSLQLVPPRTTKHLTNDQMVELLSAPGTQPNPHLAACADCAGELDQMRESLALFRQAANSYAAQELRTSVDRSLPDRILAGRANSRAWLAPAYWATAAALVMAAIIPLQMQHRRRMAPATAVSTPAAAHTSLSDAALLDAVDSELSASVPASMQALADPAGAASYANLPTPSANPDQDQRKD